MFERDYGIIVACDIDSIDVLVQLVEISKTQEWVVGYKVGFSLALRYGLRKTVETVRSLTTQPLIYDHQKAGTDIPQMAEPFAKCCSECGINGVIIFPQAGPETMRAFAEAIVDQSMVPIVGGMMTHNCYLQSDGGFIADYAPSLIYSEALKMGVTNFVLPGNRPQYVRKYATEMLSNRAVKISLLMPGIGSQGGQIKSAFDSAPEARCYAIVGSAIYGSPDPERALANFTDQVASYSKPG